MSPEELYFAMFQEKNLESDDWQGFGVFSYPF